MIRISHRGNLKGPNPSEENKPEYILRAMSHGFEVEIDVWYVKHRNQQSGFFLGHDQPQYPVPKQFLMMSSLWLHCKNIEAYDELHHLTGLNVFWHESDLFAVTTGQYLWTCDPEFPMNGRVALMIPDRPWTEVTQAGRFSHICNDWVGA